MPTLQKRAPGTLDPPLPSCMLSPGEYGSALCSEGSCDRPFLLQRRAGVAAERALPPSLMLLQEEFKKAASYSGAQGQMVHSVPCSRCIADACACAAHSWARNANRYAPMRRDAFSEVRTYIASTSRDPNLSRAHSGISGSTVFSSFSFLPDKPTAFYASAHAVCCSDMLYLSACDSVPIDVQTCLRLAYLPAWPARRLADFLQSPPSTDEYSRAMCTMGWQ